MQIKTKRLVIIVSILLVIFALTFTFMKKSKQDNGNGDVIDNSHLTIESLKKDYNIGGLVITDLDIYASDGESKFAAKITNTNDNDVKISTLKVTFYDMNNNILLSQNVIYNLNLLANKSQYMNLSSDTDLSKTYNIEFDVEYE